MHEFDKYHAESLAIGKIQLTKRIYHHFFGDDLTIQFNENDIVGQKLGIDKVVTVGITGHEYNVEEKVRPPRKNGRKYTDILLEHLSSKEQNTPGWVCKPLKADWIVYINLPYQHAYLLPVLPLQMAWQNNKQRWLGYHQKEAKNKGGYTTLSVAIPVQELFKEINNAMIFRYELMAIDKFHMKAIEIGALKNG